LDRICSFWNTEGGTLLVGIEDRTGNVVGMDDDRKIYRDIDGLVNALSQMLHQSIPGAVPSIDIDIETVGDKPILRIDVPVGDTPLYREDRFFVRNNNTTHELRGESLDRYLRRHWPRT